MLYRDTENNKIYEEHELFLEYLLNREEIEQDSGARNFVEWLRNATNKNGFLEVVSE